METEKQIPERIMERTEFHEFVENAFRRMEKDCSFDDSIEWACGDEASAIELFKERFGYTPDENDEQFKNFIEREGHKANNVCTVEEEAKFAFGSIAECLAQFIAIEENRPKEGQRVKIISPIDRYPHFLIDELGLEGVVTSTTETTIEVKLDKHFPDLDEWENTIFYDAEIVEHYFNEFDEIE